MRIARLHLKNYRRFDSLEVDFHPGLTVIAARNGRGKTTVLEAVAAALGPFVGAFDEGHAEHIKPTDVRRKPVGFLGLNELQFPVVVSASLLDGSREVISERQLTGVKSRTTTKGSQELNKWGKGLQEAVRQGEPVDLPVVVYYTSQRLAKSEKNTGSMTKTIITSSRMASYSDSLSSSVSSYAQLQYWMKSMTMAVVQEEYSNNNFSPSSHLDELKRKDPNRQSDLLRSVSCAVDSAVREEGWVDFRYNISQESLTMRHEDHGELPVSFLSDGVRAVVALVADLAVRCARLNGHYGEDASTRSSGIVLIDEVELHLHPAWQQRIVQGLRSAFPSIQFIMTTHSPQVLSTIKRESIREVFELEPGNGVTREPNEEVIGLKSSVALNEVMGVSPVPDVPEAKMIADYTKIIEDLKHDSPEGLAMREELLRRFGQGHSVLNEADALIRVQLMKRRVRGGGS